MPKKVQFGVLQSARLCLRTEKSYLAIAAPATAGRSVSGADRSSLLPAKMLDALGTTKESILPSFHLWTNVGSTFVPPGRCHGVSQACKNLCTREVTTLISNVKWTKILHTWPIIETGGGGGGGAAKDDNGDICGCSPSPPHEPAIESSNNRSYCSNDRACDSNNRANRSKYAFLWVNSFSSLFVHQNCQ